MGIPILGDIFNAVKDLASEVIVDKDKKNEILFKIKELEDRADERLHEELMGQIEVNKVEAAHPSVFVSGWRPAIGWVGAAGAAYSFVVAPLLEFVCRLFGWTGTMPELDSGQLMALVTSMLGVAGIRTYEKYQGVARDNLKLK